MGLNPSRSVAGSNIIAKRCSGSSAALGARSAAAARTCVFAPLRGSRTPAVATLTFDRPAVITSFVSKLVGRGRGCRGAARAARPGASPPACASSRSATTCLGLNSHAPGREQRARGARTCLRPSSALRHRIAAVRRRPDPLGDRIDEHDDVPAAQRVLVDGELRRRRAAPSDARSPARRRPRSILRRRSPARRLRTSNSCCACA